MGKCNKLIYFLSQIVTGHEGYMKLKLCKLNSPNEEATQTCFDKERLKIQPLGEFAYNLNEYTIRLPQFKNATTNLETSWTLEF